VGESTGGLMSTGGDWREWAIALSKDGGRGAGLALSLAPAGGAANAFAEAGGTLANRGKAALSLYRNGGMGGLTKVAESGDDALHAVTLTRDKLVDSISGVNKAGDEIAAAIRAGDIKISALGRELFEKTIKRLDATVTDDIVGQIQALQHGNKVYLRRASALIDGDLVHEGKHVLDWFKGGVRYKSVYVSEFRAYSAQRAFQIAKAGESQFSGVFDIIKHIWRNY